MKVFTYLKYLVNKNSFFKKFIKFTIIIILLLVKNNIVYSQNYDNSTEKYNQYLLLNKYDSAVILSKNTYELIKKNEGEGSINLPNILKQIGNTYSLMNNVDSAHIYYELGLYKLKEQNMVGSILEAKLYYNLAKLHFNDKIESNLENNILSSIDIISKTDNPELPFSFWPIALGIQYYKQNNNHEKVIWLDSMLLKLSLINKIKFPLEYAISNLNSASYFYYELGNYYNSEFKSKLAIQLFEEIDSTTNSNYLSALSINGLSNSELGNYKISDSIYQMSMNVYEKNKMYSTAEYSWIYGSILSNYANLCHQINLPEKGLKLRNLAVNIYQNNKLDSIFDYYVAVDNLALDYLNQYNIKEGEKYSMLIFDKFYNLHNSNIFLEAKLNHTRALIYEAKKMYDSSIYYYKIALKLSQINIKNNFNSKLYSDPYVTSIKDLAELYSSTNEYEKAVDLYNKSLIFFEDNNELELSYYDLLKNYGLLCADNQDWRLSEINLNKCILGYEKLGFNKGLEVYKVYNTLGSLYYSLGNMNLSSEYYTKAYNIIKELKNYDTIDYIHTVLLLNQAFNKSGNFKNSLPIIELITKIDSSFISSHPVIAYELGNYFASYNKLQLDVELSSDSVEVIKNRYEDFFMTDFFYYAKSFYQEAIDASQQNENHYEDYSFLLSNCYSNLGWIYMINGYWQYAESSLKKSIEINKMNGRDPNFKTITLLSRVYEKRMDYTSAYKLLYNYYESYKKYIYNNIKYLSEIERQNFYFDNRPFVSQLYKLCAKLNKSESAVITAYNLSLFDKDLLIQETKNRDRDFTKTNNINLINESINLQRYQKEYYSLVMQNELDNNKILRLQHKIDSTNSYLSRLNKSEINTLIDSINSWQDIRDNLNKNESAIEFIKYYDELDSTEYYSAIIIKSTDSIPNLIKICSERDLEMYLRQKKMDKFYTLIFKPLKKYLENISIVYYSPIGFLNSISFQGLYYGDSNHRSYIIDSISLYQVSSTKILSHKKNYIDDSVMINNIVLFGDIDYDKNSLVTTFRKNNIIFEDKKNYNNNRLINKIKKVKYLPGTKYEVEKIAENLNDSGWDVKLYEGEMASEEVFNSISKDSNISILHIATHGYTYQDSVLENNSVGNNLMNYNTSIGIKSLQCGILLSGANEALGMNKNAMLKNNNEDGILTAYELAQTDFKNVKLIVLSACQTAAGDILESEGYSGLVRALKIAGFSQAIVSIWDVPDDITSELMILFYNEMLISRKPSKAFNKALLSMRVKYPYDPELWAGFIFIRL